MSLFIRISPGYAITPPQWQIELCEGLNSLRAGNFFNPAIKNVHPFALSLQESDAAIQALVEVFIAGTEDTEIFWWKSENRAATLFRVDFTALHEESNKSNRWDNSRVRGGVQYQAFQ